MSSPGTPNVGNTGSEADPWTRPLVLLTLLWAAISALYWDSLVSMVEIWNRSETFAHGWLIPILSLWLVWRNKERLGALPSVLRPGWLLILPIVTISLVHGLANLVEVRVVEQYSYVLLLISGTVALLGLHTSKPLAFPLAYLLFAVPAGEALVPPMIDFTAWFTVQGLELSGIPVYWEGHLIAIPSGNFQVVEACSGVRYLIAALALGALYSHLSYRHWWKHIAFMLLCLVTPILANGIRAWGIVMIAHLSDMKLATGVDHLIYGWLFFGLVMFALFWLGSFWQDNPLGVSDSSTPENASQTPQAARTGLTSRQSSSQTIWAFVILIATTPGWLINHLESTPNLASDKPEPGKLLPPSIKGWRPVDEGADTGSAHSPIQDWQPEFIGAQQSALLLFEKDGHQVQLYIARYSAQKQGAELIGSGNRLFRNDRWAVQRNHAIQPANPDLPRVNEWQLRNKKTPTLIWSWYRIAGLSTHSDTLAKVAEAWGRLRGQPEASVIAIKTDYDLNIDEARSRLNDFSGALLGSADFMVQ